MTFEELKAFAKHSDVDLCKLCDKCDQITHVKAILLNPINDTISIIGENETIIVDRRELL